MRCLAVPFLALFVGCEAPRQVVPVGPPVLGPVLAMMVSGQSPDVRVVLLDRTIGIPDSEWAGLTEGEVGDTASAIADMLERSDRRWPIASGDSPVPLVSQPASDPTTLVVSVSAVGLNATGTMAALYWTVTVESRVTHIGMTLFVRPNHRAPWVIAATRVREIMRR